MTECSLQPVKQFAGVLVDCFRTSAFAVAVVAAADATAAVAKGTACIFAFDLLLAQPQTLIASLSYAHRIWLVKTRKRRVGTLEMLTCFGRSIFKSMIQILGW